MSYLDDGDWAVAAKSGGKRISFPIDGDAVSYITEQDWTQARASFAAKPLNEADPDDPLTFLVGESALQDIGGGIAKWTRIYARVPAARNEFETFAYTFPGFTAHTTTERIVPWSELSGTFAATDDPGRMPRAASVTSRLAYSYFLVGANGQYELPTQIPLLSAQRYTYGTYFGTFSVSAYNDLPDRILWRNADYANGTSPTVESWLVRVTAAVGDVPDVTTGAYGNEIIAEDSRLRRWRGNIYERVTRYVKAQ